MLGKKANISVGGDFGTVPADKYTVQIADVNFKMMFNKFKGTEEERLNFKFIILNDKPMSEDEGSETVRGRYLWHAVSQSLSTRSWLMKLAKAVYGRDLTKEELDPTNPKFFDPEKIIGEQVDVMVTEDPNKDNTATFNNVTAYAKTKTKLEPVKADRVVQEEVESETKPAVAVPNLNPALDDFLNELEGEESEETLQEESEDSLEELEEKLKLAKAKAKEAKAK